MMRLIGLPILTATLLMTAACGSKPSPSQISDMAPGDGSEQAQTEDTGPGTQADLVRNAGADRVFFNVDSFTLSSEAQATLRRQAAWLAANPGVSITIEGHCDERGTRDYNIALGSRRADAAKNFLAAQGVPVSRMSTVSYGKERPEALGSDETSYSQNRRAVSIVIH